ncbi:hypothetical protein DFH06DRAFT_1133727 [Mycena polygramma]|nr:hypothetical protein DFH06DRAFT_1133727 [Mycena polygramma]
MYVLGEGSIPARPMSQIKDNNGSAATKHYSPDPSRTAVARSKLFLWTYVFLMGSYDLWFPPSIQSSVTVAEYNISPLDRWHCEEKPDHLSFGLILARLPVSCRTTVFFGSNFNDGIKIPNHGYEQLRIRSAIPTRVTPKESDQN